MDSQNPSNEITHDFSPRFRVYKDGRVERLAKVETIPPSLDPKTGVLSKDVIISSGLSARIYLPRSDPCDPKITKLPVLIYFHGGAFCQFSSSSSIFHHYLNSLVSKAQVIAVSADYRLAPEHPIPACYDDSWAVAQWVAAQSTRSGSSPWLTRWADFDQVYFAGDSAGANISYNLLDRAGPDGLLGPGVTVSGIVLIHPFFGDGEPDKLWEFLCPSTTGTHDPRFYPMGDPTRMSQVVGDRRVMVCVDKGDWLRERGVKYYEALKESGWGGELGFYESNGGDHVFFLNQIDDDEAVSFLNKIACFINKK